jgi:peptidoglycan/xylan/chitin deacetylase (PgdA/CDA1 family)
VGWGERGASVIERSGLEAVLARVPTWRGVLVLGYHRIGAPVPGAHDTALWSATQDEFDRQLSFLKRCADIVSGGDLPAALEAPRGRQVALTFDDGYRDNHELAYPVLRANDLPAVFFLATGFLDRPRVAWWDEIAWMVRSSPHSELEPGDWLSAPVPIADPRREAAVRTLASAYGRLGESHTSAFLDWLGRASGSGRAGAAQAASTWMTWDMVREMRRGGMSFGAHTVDHPVLARCSIARQRREIAGSVARIREELGEAPTLLSYPIGSRSSFDESTRACAREAGITHAFSFYGGYQRPDRLDPLDIPRTFVAPSRSAARFRAGVTLPRLFARPDRLRGHD